MLAFPTSQGEEAVVGKTVDQRRQDPLGNFPQVPGREWAPAQPRKNNVSRGGEQVPARTDAWGTTFYNPKAPLSGAPEARAGWCQWQFVGASCPIPLLDADPPLPIT